MSLTITQQPQVFTPAYNNQYVSATSTKYTQPNFKYTVTVSVNGATVHTEGILPRPDGSMVFNAKKWVENYITHYFNPIATNFSVATGKTANVSISILEDYSVSPIPSATTFTYVAFDASLTETEFAAYDYKNYISGGNSNVTFLGQSFSQLMVDTRVNLTQQVFLHFTLGNISYVKLTYNDGIVQQLTITPIIPSPSNIYNIYRLDVGAGLLGGLDGTNVTIEFFNVSNVSLAYYTYTLANICTKYTDYPVYYLNRFGNIPFMHFEKKSTDKLTKTVNKVRLGKNQLVAGVYTSNSWDREVHIVSTESVRSGVLNTDWITESQSTTLQDLFDSPIVWTLSGTTYTPITIKETTYDFKKRVNDKLFNYSIDFEYSDTKIRQRGI